MPRPRRHGSRRRSRPTTRGTRGSPAPERGDRGTPRTGRRGRPAAAIQRLPEIEAAGTRNDLEYPALEVGDLLERDREPGRQELSTYTRAEGLPCRALGDGELVASDLGGDRRLKPLDEPGPADLDLLLRPRERAIPRAAAEAVAGLEDQHRPARRAEIVGLRPGRRARRRSRSRHRSSRPSSPLLATPIRAGRGPAPTRASDGICRTAPAFTAVRPARSP